MGKQFTLMNVQGDLQESTVICLRAMCLSIAHQLPLASGQHWLLQQLLTPVTAFGRCIHITELQLDFGPDPAWRLHLDGPLHHAEPH